MLFRSALVNAVKGKVDQALLFCGANAYRATRMEHVKDIMDEFRPVQAGVC